MDPVYPLPLKLGDHDLPWVVHATHLGHELHQMCNMEYDISVKRAQFIDSSVKIQETFSFARPDEVMKAVETYAEHWYGSMLWDLFGVKADQLYKSWNTCAKVVWGVPRSTHTYLLDNLLVANFLSVKQQLVGRYINFVRNLINSSSPEVCVVSSMVARCARSTTGKNLKNIERETGMDPWTDQSWRIQEAIQRREVPKGEGWRIQYLAKLLDARLEMKDQCQDLEEINSIIDSLCSS